MEQKDRDEFVNLTLDGITLGVALGGIILWFVMALGLYDNLFKAAAMVLLVSLVGLNLFVLRYDLIVQRINSILCIFEGRW
jgi:hypothetical protein